MSFIHQKFLFLSIAGQSKITKAKNKEIPTLFVNKSLLKLDNHSFTFWFQKYWTTHPKIINKLSLQSLVYSSYLFTIPQ